MRIRVFAAGHAAESKVGGTEQARQGGAPFRPQVRAARQGALVEEEEEEVVEEEEEQQQQEQ